MTLASFGVLASRAPDRPDREALGPLGAEDLALAARDIRINPVTLCGHLARHSPSP